MKVRFTEDGFLQAECAGNWKQQECPYTTGELESPCGDWCPLLFEFPKTKSWHKTIIICNNVHCELVEDLRGKG